MKSCLSIYFLILLTFCSTTTAARKVTHIYTTSYIPNQFQGTEDSVNLMPLSTANMSYKVSSCYIPDKCGFNLFDSNPSTVWTTSDSKEAEWVIVDFSEKRLMNRVDVVFPQGRDVLISEYYIQVLKRGEWFNIAHNKSPRTKTSNFIGNIDATLIRILFPKMAAVSYEVSDVRVYLNESLLSGVDRNLTGYRFPVPNGLLPQDDYSLPGAPRAYRNGIHKGIDIAYKANELKQRVHLTRKDAVVATADGEVVRSDKDYEPMTQRDYDDITAYNQKNRVTFVDKDFGGRQIWIDHGNGVMTSYNHLSNIEKWVKVGAKVRKGDVLGRVGNSGLKGEAMGDDSNIHLHFEIWVKGEFVGKGLNAENSKKFLQYFFSE